MSAKLTDFYVMKMNAGTGQTYAVKVHGAQFIHKGLLIRAHIDKRHTMHFVDPESGDAIGNYVLPFVRDYSAQIERNYLRTAHRYLQWKDFKRYQKRKEEPTEAYLEWIRRFQKAKKYDSDQEVLDEISKKV